MVMLKEIPKQLGMFQAVPGLNLGSAQWFLQLIVGRDAWEPEAEEAQNSIASKGCFAAIEVKDKGSGIHICTYECFEREQRLERGWMKLELGQSLDREILWRPWMETLVGEFRWRAWRESSDVELRWSTGTELGKSFDRSWMESLYGEVGWRA